MSDETAAASELPYLNARCTVTFKQKLYIEYFIFFKQESVINVLDFLTSCTCSKRSTIIDS